MSINHVQNICFSPYNEPYFRYERFNLISQIGVHGVPRTGNNRLWNNAVGTSGFYKDIYCSLATR